MEVEGSLDLSSAKFSSANSCAVAHLDALQYSTCEAGELHLEKHAIAHQIAL